MDSRKENPEGQPVKQVYVVEHFVRSNFGDGFSFRHMLGLGIATGSMWIGLLLFLSFIR